MASVISYFFMKKGAFDHMVPVTFFSPISCKTTREKDYVQWQQDLRPEQLLVKLVSRFCLVFLCYLTITNKEASVQFDRIKRFLAHSVWIFSTLILSVDNIFSLKQ